MTPLGGVAGDDDMPADVDVAVAVSAPGGVAGVGGSAGVISGDGGGAGEVSVPVAVDWSVDVDGGGRRGRW